MPTRLKVFQEPLVMCRPGGKFQRVASHLDSCEAGFVQKLAKERRHAPADLSTEVHAGPM